ncbi:MAG: hypothetical protein N3G22_01285 [Candidatus Micrarchaeota archaeon]|nr:hypothetical protein [Candidatus Micrarchaeota archaeon]
MAAFKGQGATEYLVLLAVVLIIALISIALLNFFPGIAADAKITQSEAYWKGEAKPFSIQSHSFTTAGTLTLVVQNVGPDALTISAINVSGAGISGSPTMSPSTPVVGGGATQTITLSGYTVGGGATAGNIYELTINISYTNPNGLSLRQFGAKPLVGKYT